MARLEGGIFSRPRGKTGGLVFGAARTREGKVVTSRLLVNPSNPNTTEQQTQRNKFKESLAIVRAIGASIYQDDFNRSISQLPGFQSMMSIFMNAMDSSYDLSEPSTVNLGNLSIEDDTFNFGSSGGGILSATYGPDNGDNGTSADVVVLTGIDVSKGATPNARKVFSDVSYTRADEGSSVGGFTVGSDVLLMAYMRGAGNAEGLLSKCYFGIVTATA